MNEYDMQRIADEAASRAVKQTLVALGVDVENPLEFQKDMQHLRAWREAKDTIRKQGLTSAVGVIVVAGLGLLWATFKGYL